MGVGLDSAELGNPCTQYQAVFERAASEGLKCVAHAGVHPVPLMYCHHASSLKRLFLLLQPLCVSALSRHYPLMKLLPGQ